MSALKPTRVGTPIVCELLSSIQYSWEQARLRGWVHHSEAIGAILESVHLEASLQEREADEMMVVNHIRTHIQRRKDASFADVQRGRLEEAKREIHLAGFLEGMLPAWVLP